jgi:predicted ATPase
MLTKITLENFKVFRHATEFPLAKINLLTGINGRGKSSLLQSLLLMRQSIEQDKNTTVLILNGSCVHLGNWEDVKNREEPKSKGIKIFFEYEKNNDKDKISLSYYCSMSERILSIDKFVIETKINDLHIEGYGYCEKGKPLELMPYDLYFNHNEIPEKHWQNLILDNITLEHTNNNETGYYLPEPLNNTVNFLKIHYISADRIGAKDFYPKSLNFGRFITLDKKGENILDILFHYQEKSVHKYLYRKTNEFSQMTNLAYDIQIQVGEWMGWVLDADVKVILVPGAYVNQLEFEINGKKFKPSNVGFGYPYILPIITAGLIAKEGEILIVENPEAHLHPKAQSRLTEFLAKVAATGVQVFVESHSDHILNALRVCVKQEKIPANDVNVLFFSTDKITQEPKVSFPKIDADGRIDVWEDDFFDEIDKSLMNLL